MIVVSGGDVSVGVGDNVRSLHGIGSIARRRVRVGGRGSVATGGCGSTRSTRSQRRSHNGSRAALRRLTRNNGEVIVDDGAGVLTLSVHGVDTSLAVRVEDTTVERSVESEGVVRSVEVGGRSVSVDSSVSNLNSAGDGIGSQVEFPPFNVGQKIAIDRNVGGLTVTVLLGPDFNGVTTSKCGANESVLIEAQENTTLNSGSGVLNASDDGEVVARAVKAQSKTVDEVVAIDVVIASDISGGGSDSQSTSGSVESQLASIVRVAARSEVLAVDHNVIESSGAVASVVVTNGGLSEFQDEGGVAEGHLFNERVPSTGVSRSHVVEEVDVVVEVAVSLAFLVTATSSSKVLHEEVSVLNQVTHGVTNREGTNTNPFAAHKLISARFTGDDYRERVGVGSVHVDFSGALLVYVQGPDGLRPQFVVSEFVAGGLNDDIVIAARVISSGLAQVNVSAGNSLLPQLGSDFITVNGVVGVFTQSPAVTDLRDEGNVIPHHRIAPSIGHVFEGVLVTTLLFLHISTAKKQTFVSTKKFRISLRINLPKSNDASFKSSFVGSDGQRRFSPSSGTFGSNKVDSNNSFLTGGESERESNTSYGPQFGVSDFDVANGDGGSSEVLQLQRTSFERRGTARDQNSGKTQVIVKETGLDGAGEVRALTKVSNNHFGSGLDVTNNDDQVIKVGQKAVFNAKNIFIILKKNKIRFDFILVGSYIMSPYQTTCRRERCEEELERMCSKRLRCKQRC